MRLISAHVTGFGRLANAKVNLDSRLLAFVGPNESGKSTFLSALAFLSSGGVLDIYARSRAIEVTADSQVIEAMFILDDEDRAALLELDLEEPPKSVTISRKADGAGARVGVHPYPRKSRVTLLDALKTLKKYASRTDLEDLLSPDTTYMDPTGDAPRHFPSELNELIKMMGQVKKKDASVIDNNDLSQRASLLAGALEKDEKTEDIRAALETVEAWGSREHPDQQARNILYSRMPAFLLFGDGERSIASSYALDDNLRTNPSPAIRNLASMAGLDLGQLVQATIDGDISRRETLLLQANKLLAKRFNSTWKQSKLSVILRTDAMTLRVDVIENGEAVTVFHERSAGFRMFVALVAFLAVQHKGVLPILLIDEAENHLHIDAQADLINMLVSQDEVAKVIYTTHSPACLPPDLGVGVRAVIPDKDGNQVSTISNSFWVEGAGYSPLMIAMGAGAAAFSTARYVVLAEGATEMLMLPSVIRAVTKLETLPYQIAPGLSEAKPEMYTSLDLEGAKVAYLTDGDKGGNSLKKALIASGVPGHLIVTLPVPGIENLMPQNIYLGIIRELLLEQLAEKDIPTFPELGESTSKSWAKQMEAWAGDNNIKLPSKIAIANKIVVLGKARPDSVHDASLIKLHEDILAALKIQWRRHGRTITACPALRV